MFQVLLVLIIILVLGLGGFLFFTRSSDKQLTEASLSVEESVESSVLGQEKKIEQESKEIINTSKDGVQDNISQTAESINNFLEEKVAQVLGQKNEVPKVEVIEPGVVVEGIDQELKFDLTKDKNRKMSLKVGSKYLLDFQNVPEGFCLYINNQQYQLSDSKKILFQFSSSGNYPLKMDFCDSKHKDLGEFEVN
jgi:hypothetical protein